MATRVFLHVGTPKSGTTYVQTVLTRNKAALAEREKLLFPGDTWISQVHAARDVLEFDSHGEGPAAWSGAWDRLAAEIRAWHGTAVVSMEWLGSADARRIQRMVDSLAPAQVEVVITVRDLARTLTAAWQEFMQNWETWSWQEFLASVADETPGGTPPGRLFWDQQDLGRLLSRYSSVVDPSRIHLVPLPPPGASSVELLNRLGRVLGVDFARYDLTGGGNESLGLESTLLMRRVNLASREHQLGWAAYDRQLKHVLAKNGLSKRKPRETSLAVPESVRPWVEARTKDQIAAIHASGVQVHGDLDDLQPHHSASGRQPEDVTVEEILDAAVEGIVRVARSVHARNQSSPPSTSARPPLLTVRGRTPRAMAHEAADRHPLVDALRRRYRTTRRALTGR